LAADLWGEHYKKRCFGGTVAGPDTTILGGIMWTAIFPGFESEAAIFLGILMITLPSAVGGGVAGWQRSRSRKILFALKAI